MHEARSGHEVRLRPAEESRVRGVARTAGCSPGMALSFAIDLLTELPHEELRRRVGEMRDRRAREGAANGKGR
jgi:hypothetical protein